MSHDFSHTPIIFPPLIGPRTRAESPRMCSSVAVSIVLVPERQYVRVKGRIRAPCGSYFACFLPSVLLLSLPSPLLLSCHLTQVGIT